MNRRRAARIGLRGARPKPPASGVRPGLGKLALWTAATVATALVGGLVTYYLPAALSSGPGKPVLVDVTDDPELISSFASGSQTLALPSDMVTRPGDPHEPFCGDFHRWGRQLGGVDAGATRFRVTLQGNTDQAVVITQVRARILQRSDAPAGIYVGCPTAGNASIRSLSIDLDRPEPVADEKDADVHAFGVTLKQGETEIFDVSALTRAANRAITWTLLMHATINGKTQDLEVQDRGRPFRTRGPPPADSPVYEWGDSWQPRSPFP